MAPLIENRYLRLVLDLPARAVSYIRSDVPFASADDFLVELEKILAALAPLDRKKHVLLLDLRHGPLRNDPTFEAVAVRFRIEVPRDFARTAILVATHVGRLQILRHAQEHGGQPAVFLDEAAARKHLGLP